MNVVENGQVFDSLYSCIQKGDHGLRTVPGLLVKIINLEGWRKFLNPKTRQEIEHETFVSFVETSPPRGLGAKMDTLRGLCRDDATALDALDRATQNQNGGDRKSEKAKISVDNVNTDRPDGNSTARALRTLRTRRPDLHAQVLEGLKSAHAAMVEAGFRHKTVTVRADDPVEFVRGGLRLFTAEQIIIAVRRLQESSGEGG